MLRLWCMGARVHVSQPCRVPGSCPLDPPYFAFLLVRENIKLTAESLRVSTSCLHIPVAVLLDVQAIY